MYWNFSLINLCVYAHKLVCICMIITFVMLSNNFTYFLKNKHCLKGIINYRVQHIFLVSSLVFPLVIILNNI